MYNRQIPVEEALREGAALPFLLKDEQSVFFLGENRLLSEPDWDTLVELRFFGPAREIRVFRREGQWQAALLEKEQSDCCIEKTYELENERYGGSITVRTWLEADEDGQMNSAAVALCGWEKEAKKRVQP